MLATLLFCIAIDGDTLLCKGERIRLVGIDAPELPGHCAAHRHCVAGDPFASKRVMQRILDNGITLRRVGRDRYGRTLAHAYVGRASVACIMVKYHFAEYKPWWDDGGVSRDCGFHR